MATYALSSIFPKKTWKMREILNFWHIHLDANEGFIFSLQITVDGEVVTDPDITLR
jgi:hypothetical protein